MHFTISTLEFYVLFFKIIILEQLFPVFVFPIHEFLNSTLRVDL